MLFNSVPFRFLFRLSEPEHPGAPMHVRSSYFFFPLPLKNAFFTPYFFLFILYLFNLAPLRYGSLRLQTRDFFVFSLFLYLVFSLSFFFSLAPLLSRHLCLLRFYAPFYSTGFRLLFWSRRRLGCVTCSPPIGLAVSARCT